MPDIFLSYSRDDLPIAQRFAEAFEQEGFSVWWDQTLNPGEAYDHVTEKALKEARAVVVLWSQRSVESRWVRAEATLAERNKTLVPVMIEPCERPIMFELTHTADLSHWKGDPKDRAWQAYVAGVRRFTERDAPNPSPRPAPRVASASHSRPSIWVLAALVVGALLWSVFWALRSDKEPVAAVAPSATAPVTLAVLPFANLSSDPEQEYFSDGLTEEILNQLAQVKALRVTARTSSFSFKGKNEDVRVIGEKLGVANLLEGSIRKDGDTLRITAQLVNSEDGAHLWSKTYDRELAGVFALQDEVAKDVARALSVTLDVGESSRALGGTTNVEAYDKYLQAFALMAHQEVQSRVAKAVQLCRDAVELDPGFVRAWELLAAALRLQIIWRPELAGTLDREQENAFAQIEKLAPQSPQARAIQVQRLMNARKWPEAELAATGSTWLRAQFLSAVGRFSEVLVTLERARQLDPLSLSLSTNSQLVLDATGRVAEAQAEYERSRALAGDHVRAEFFALLRYMARKDADPATVKARFRAYLKNETQPLVLDPAIANKIEDIHAVRAILRRAFEDPRNQEGTRMGIIALYASHLGDVDLALAALRRSLIELRDENFIYAWLAYGADVRADPRFKEILRDMKLVEYFRATGNWGDFCKPVGDDDFECH